MATVSVDSLVSVDPGQLPSSVGVLYTATGTKFQLTNITLVNDTTTAVTATIYNVPNAGSPGVTNILLGPVSLPLDGTPLVFEFGEFYIETGGTIQGVASVASQVNYHISGKELNVA